jgi:hypothetical protein
VWVQVLGLLLEVLVVVLVGRLVALALALVLHELMEVEVEHVVLPQLLLLREVNMWELLVCPDFLVPFLGYLGCARTVQLIRL